jgi:multidrug efflux pump subunit AcrA (membrane-fusion protein)
MNGLQNNWVSYTAIGILGLMAASGLMATSRQLPSLKGAIAQIPSPIPNTTPANPANPSSGRLVKINLSVTSPEDLKVREGDTVSAGQVLADRDKERARLTAQREQIQLSLNKIEQTELLPPPKPLPVPEVAELPPIFYKEEEAAISAAQLALEQAQRNYELAMQTTPFIKQQSSVEMAQAKVTAQEREVELQTRKLDAIATLKGLPPEVAAHETEQLKRKTSEHEQRRAEHSFAAAELKNAQEERTAQLKALADEVNKAQANVRLAQSRLDTARTKRGYDEYQNSITKARRAEETNQFNQSQVRQQQEYSQQLRDREFQLAQLKAKLGEIDQQISQLSIVRSPYAGTIRRIKNVSQTNQDLQFEITLVVGGDRPISPRIPSFSPKSLTRPNSSNPITVPTPPPIPTR